MTSQSRFHLSTDLRLPTLPAHIERLTAMIDAPDACTAEVGALIKQDPSLALKVLRTANSAFYGLGEPCLSIEQASTVLGLRLLRSIVIHAALLQKYEHLEDIGLDLERLWKRSVLVGQAGALISSDSNSLVLPSPDEAYLTGLLADIGQVILLDSIGSEYVEIHARAQDHNLPLHLVERRDLGTTHADVGAMLASAWGLPLEVRLGIEWHHGRRASDFQVPAVYLVQRAGQIADRVVAGQLAEAASPMDAQLEQQFGLRAQAVALAIAHVRDSERKSRSEAA